MLRKMQGRLGKSHLLDIRSTPSEGMTASPA